MTLGERVVVGVGVGVGLEVQMVSGMARGPAGEEEQGARLRMRDW